jgi:hypothetical protein
VASPVGVKMSTVNRELRRQDSRLSKACTQLLRLLRDYCKSNGPFFVVTRWKEPTVYVGVSVPIDEGLP